MEIRQNPYVTQLAIARPNPFQMDSKTSKRKESKKMLLGRSSSMRALGSAHHNPAPTSALGDASLAKRLELQKAISRMEKEASSSGKSISTPSKAGTSVSKAPKTSATKASSSSHEPTLASGFFQGEEDMSRSVSKNPAKRRTTLKSAAKGSGARKGLVSSVMKQEGAAKVKTLNKANIKTLVSQINLMKQQYELSGSPSLKKKLDRAVSQLGKLQGVVRKDLDRLDEASKILAKANPLKGGSMSAVSNPKKKSSSAKKSTARKTSSAIYEKLLADLKKARAAKAAKKKTAKKTTARKSSAKRLHRNPLEAIETALAGLEGLEGIENGRRKKKATRKSSARKTTARKATTRRNPGTGLIVVGTENPRRKKKATRKASTRKTTVRKATTRRNPGTGLIVVGTENPRRKKRATRKSSVRKTTAVRRTTRRNPGTGLIVVGTENPRRKKRATRKSSVRKTTTVRKTRRNPEVTIRPVGGLTNPRRRKKATRKASARKTTAVRKTRRNPEVTIRPVGGLTNPRRRKKATRKASSRKTTAVRKTRRNPEVTIRPVGGLTNPRRRKKATRKASSRKTIAHRKTRRNAAPAVVKDSFTFSANARKRKSSRKASTRKATTRRSATRRSATRRSATRRNPIPATTRDSFSIKLNPKKRSSVAKKRTSSLKRMGGLSRSVVEALRHFGPDFVTIHRGGRNTTIKAQTSSAEYKQGKAKGLYGRFAHLSGKKNTPYSLNIRSLHSMVGGTPSVADIQKAVNVWAGAHAGGHLGKKAAANPATRRKKRSTVAAKKRRTTTRKSAKGRKSVKGRKKSTRRNPMPATTRDSFTLKLNPKKRRKTSSKKRKASVKSTRKTSSSKKRKSSAKKKHHARRNPVQALRMNPMGYALMHHNPLMPTMGSYGVLTARELHSNPAETSMGMKVAIGAGSFLAGMVASNTLVGIAHGNDTVDTASTGYMLKEYGIPVALTAALAGAYHATAEENRSDALKVGVASAIAGIAGSVIARNVVSVENIFANIPGLSWLLNAGSEKNSRFKAVSGYFPQNGYVPTGRFIPEPPAATLEGYMSDAYQGLEGYSDMGRYGLTPTSGVSDMGRYGLTPTSGVSDMGRYGLTPTSGFSFDDDGLDGYIPTGSYGDFADDSEHDFDFNEDEDDMRSRLNGYHTTGALVPMAEDTEGFVLSSQNVKAPTRIGAEGLDIQTLAQELKEVEALDVNARKAEGLPDIENVDVAIIRATPYYARVIADSNLGYILKASSVVKGSYIVGLYVGPDSLLFNTGMGAKDLNIPHGARTARPAGIFTNTVFSSVLPAVDGNVVWAGGDEGDF